MVLLVEPCWQSCSAIYPVILTCTNASVIIARELHDTMLQSVRVGKQSGNL